MTALDRYRGCLLGLAAGDAVGTTVEFEPRGSFPPVTDMTGGGPFRLPAGAWTDDTSMALCLAASLGERKRFDAGDQMARYLRWCDDGYLSSTGRCFDIGVTTRAALERYRKSGDPFAGAPDPWSAGNGCLMRLAPVPIFAHARGERAGLSRLARDSARTTHAAPECLEATELLAEMLYAALDGASKSGILSAASPARFTTPKVRALAAGDFVRKPEGAVRGSGYAVDCLEAAAWCFARAADFRGAALLAANLGDDADTTAAVAGQLAGAFYGEPGLPPEWLAKLAMRDEIAALAEGLAAT